MPPRDANWIDGIRGIASSLVVCGHLCTAFAPWLHSPAIKDQPTSLFQLPFFRLCVGGRAGVAIFFLITGYVNSIGPISKVRAGNVDAAFLSIARSSLARAGRLILPVILATLFSWFLAQTKAYYMTEHVDSTWIRQGFHQQDPNIFLAFWTLLRAQMSTWTTGWNEYDGTQWTLVLFLEGSFMVYVTMMATVLVTPNARRWILAVLYVYSWASGCALKSMNIVCGMLLADLHVEYGSSATTVLPCGVPSLLIAFGLVMCCYPQDAPENALWSRTMRDIMFSLTPQDADLRRFWDSVGASTLMLGIFFHGAARGLLTTDFFNFLGKVSFPVYLLHNQLMKSVLAWVVYLPSFMNPQFDEKGKPLDWQRGSTAHVFASVAIFYCILYRLAWLWHKHIDPRCATLVNKATTWAYGEYGVGEKPSTLV